MFPLTHAFFVAFSLMFLFFIWKYNLHLIRINYFLLLIFPWGCFYGTTSIIEAWRDTALENHLTSRDHRGQMLNVPMQCPTSIILISYRFVEQFHVYGSRFKWQSFYTLFEDLKRGQVCLFISRSMSTCNFHCHSKT